MGIKIGPVVEKLLDEVIVSFMEWDLIVYFYHNRNVCATSLDIARQIGRNSDEVTKSLGLLESKGILELKKKGRFECYQLVPDTKWTNAIEEFMNCLEDRLSRLEIFSRLISHEYK